MSQLAAKIGHLRVHRGNLKVHTATFEIYVGHWEALIAFIGHPGVHVCH